MHEETKGAQGAMVAVESGADTVAGVLTHVGYLGAAEACLRAIKILEPRHSEVALPHAMLASHALECLLKAYISKVENPDFKRERRRHNLAGLWTWAQGAGLAIATQPPQWVLNLTDLHDSTFLLRYPTTVHSLVSRGLEPMTTELLALSSLVRAAISVR